MSELYRQPATPNLPLSPPPPGASSASQSTPAEERMITAVRHDDDLATVQALLNQDNAIIACTTKVCLKGHARGLRPAQHYRGEAGTKRRHRHRFSRRASNVCALLNDRSPAFCTMMRCAEQIHSTASGSGPGTPSWRWRGCCSRRAQTRKEAKNQVRGPRRHLLFCHRGPPVLCLHRQADEPPLQYTGGMATTV